MHPGPGTEGWGWLLRSAARAPARPERSLQAAQGRHEPSPGMPWVQLTQIERKPRKFAHTEVATTAALHRHQGANALLPKSIMPHPCQHCPGAEIPSLLSDKLQVQSAVAGVASSRRIDSKRIQEQGREQCTALAAAPLPASRRQWLLLRLRHLLPCRQLCICAGVGRHRWLGGGGYVGGVGCADARVAQQVEGLGE